MKNPKTLIQIDKRSSDDQVFPNCPERHSAEVRCTCQVAPKPVVQSGYLRRPSLDRGIFVMCKTRLDRGPFAMCETSASGRNAKTGELGDRGPGTGPPAAIRVTTTFHVNDLDNPMEISNVCSKSKQPTRGVQ